MISVTDLTSLDTARSGAALRRYRQADGVRAACELAVTSIAFAVTVCAMGWAADNDHYWLYALLLGPGTGFLVRLFIIQHDCAHRSFLPGRRANDWLGRMIGVVTLTPHDHWRMSHAYHHASSGDLDRRGIGDVRTMTVAEYLARSPWARLKYRLYRHPAVTFGLGPLYLFLFHNRWPAGFTRSGWLPWISTMSTNVAIVIALALVVGTLGLRALLWTYVPLVLLASAAGVWLFYVQHQFEHTYWARHGDWNARDAALFGSSHYDLPALVRWFTGNIGLHHVHHLSSKIPFYRLPDVLRDHPEFRALGRVTVLESFSTIRLVLWDEKRRRLISLKQLRRENAPRLR